MDIRFNVFLLHAIDNGGEGVGPEVVANVATALSASRLLDGARRRSFFSILYAGCR